MKNNDSSDRLKTKVSKLNLNTVRGRLFIGCWLMTFVVDVIFLLFGLSFKDPELIRNILFLMVPPVVVMILSCRCPYMSVLALTGFLPYFIIDGADPLYSDFLLHFVLTSAIPASVSGIFLISRGFFGSSKFKAQNSIVAVVAFSIIACFCICEAECAFDDLLMMDEENTIVDEVFPLAYIVDTEVPDSEEQIEYVGSKVIGCCTEVLLQCPR